VAEFGQYLFRVIAGAAVVTGLLTGVVALARVVEHSRVQRKSDSTGAAAKTA
jgi:hypothetical protein